MLFYLVKVVGCRAPPKAPRKRLNRKKYENYKAIKLQAVRALWICTRLFLREHERAGIFAREVRTARNNAYIGVTNPFTPTTASQAPYRLRRFFMLCIQNRRFTHYAAPPSPQKCRFASFSGTPFISTPRVLFYLG